MASALLTEWEARDNVSYNQNFAKRNTRLSTESAIHARIYLEFYDDVMR